MGALEAMDKEDPDQARRIASLDAALDQAISMASIRAELPDEEHSNHPFIGDALRDIRALIRSAVLDLLVAVEDLQDRFDLSDESDGIDRLPPALIAYTWTREVLHDVLTRAGFEVTSSFTPDGRFVYGYSPPRGPSLDDLVKRMELGPDGEVAIRPSDAGPRGEMGQIRVSNAELKVLRAAQRLLRSDSSLYPPTGIPAPDWMKDEVFPIGWPEEDCERAHALLQLGRTWKEESNRRGAGSKAARRAYSTFFEACDYFLTFLHRYFELPRAGADSPFAREAERLSAALYGLEATLFWSPNDPLREVPTSETWLAMERLAGAVAELDAAVAAYRSPHGTVAVAEVGEPREMMPGKRRRRGRPQKRDVGRDKKICEAWSTKTYKEYKDLSVELGLHPEEVKAAVDRERKRRAASNTARLNATE